MGKAQAKRRYSGHMEAVREIIHRWDPYGLLALGCPLDEFDGEIAAVVRQIQRIASPQDAAHTISRVFSSAFEPGRFAIEDCTEVGRQLYDILEERDLLAKSESEPE